MDYENARSNVLDPVAAKTIPANASTYKKH